MLICHAYDPEKGGQNTVFETSIVLIHDKIAPNCIASNWMQIFGICGQLAALDIMHS